MNRYMYAILFSTTVFSTNIYSADAGDVHQQFRACLLQWAEANSDAWKKVKKGEEVGEFGFDLGEEYNHATVFESDVAKSPSQIKAAVKAALEELSQLIRGKTPKLFPDQQRNYEMRKNLKENNEEVQQWVDALLGLTSLLKDKHHNDWIEDHIDTLVENWQNI